jgi:hypothetical protein
MEHSDREMKLPLSRRVSVAETPAEGLDLVITASPAERRALSTENELTDLMSLEAILHVAHAGAQGLEVSGELRAKLRQTCVVTLEDFDSEIVEPVHARFAPLHELNGAKAKGREAETESSGHHLHMLDEEDPPDPLIGGEIDVGALAGEFLTLALDPYPRKPGVVFAEPNSAQADAEDSPFARLREMVPRTSKRGEP